MEITNQAITYISPFEAFELYTVVAVFWYVLRVTTNYATRVRDNDECASHNIEQENL